MILGCFFFVFDGNAARWVKFEIKEISDRWYQAQPTPDWPVADYFKVCTADNTKYIIKHELKSDQWFLVTLEATIIRFSSN